ncbi:diguanylate cyclase [Hydrogenovibrio sp. SC-1]|nr:diguanylate cyclase [Hydrogenovibrio sp. SC-1]
MQLPTEQRLKGIGMHWQIEGRLPRSLVKKYSLIVALWSGLILGSWFYNLHGLEHATWQAASSAALATVNKDVSFRKWGASHGGVYVPPTDKTPPNPYLDIPERDVVTTSGKKLTLVNPAYMLRDMQSQFGDEYGIKTHLTSLNLLNPHNKADAWEITALKQFEQNAEPIQEISLIQGQPYMRLIRPLMVEKTCMKCHAHQGYQVGQIRGGISTFVPMAPFLERETQRKFEMQLSHLAVWIIGVMGLTFGWRRESKLKSEHDRQEKALLENEALYRSVTNNGQVMIWLADASRRYTFFNQPWLEFVDLSLEQALAQDKPSNIDNEDRSFYQQTLSQAYSKHEKFSLVYRMKRHDGQIRSILEEASPHYDSSGQFSGFIGHCLDITEFKEAKSEAEYLAQYDVLTQLPNRRLMQTQLTNAIDSCKSQGTIGALILIDLDNFKQLNDTQGYEVGDALLKLLAERIHTILPEDATLGRFGGDEFVVLISMLNHTQASALELAEKFGRKLLRLIQQAFYIGEHEYQTSCSLGITLFNGGPNTQEEVFKHAELAMYQAKENGRNNLRFFDPEMQSLLSARTELESALRQAINRQEFELFLQPQVNSQAKIIGAEALIRWRHPEKGLISPISFIPLAEETGLIVPIGHWVLTQACDILKQWSSNPDLNHLTLAVNVSAKQFHLAEFESQVSELLEPEFSHHLKLELTESLFLSSVDEAISKMTALKAKGVSFSLDDFGTGYSSLTYLKRLPLDQLKIDQGFIRDLLVDENDKAIAQTIIALSDSLNLSVIAEGVETSEHQQTLARMGCQNYQGYYFGKPQPQIEFEAQLKNTHVIAS